MEQAAEAGARVLLEQGGEGALPEQGALAGDGGLVLPAGPECRAGSAAERVVRLGQRGQAQDAPGVRAVRDAAAEIVRVPAGHDEDDAPAGLEAGGEVGAEPVPELVAGGGAVGLGLRLDRVVDEDEVGAAPGDGAAHAGGVVFGAGGGGEAVGGAAAGVEGEAEAGGVGLDEAADAASEVAGEGGGVAGGDDAGARVAGEPPGREDERGVGGLGAAGRQEQHQAVGAGGGDVLEFADDEAVVGGGMMAAGGEGEGGPGGEVGADALAERALSREVAGRPGRHRSWRRAPRAGLAAGRRGWR